MAERRKDCWPGWETVGLIGRGSFGAVYEIQRSVFGDIEKAALKVITIPQNASDIDEMYSDGYDDESITSTFQNHLKSIVAEYSLMRKMNGSANIVNCDDIRYVQHDDGIGWDIYIKMELLTPLTKALPFEIPEETVVKIAKDMCSALELCKKHGIVHRDIKPQNIFVSPNGDYKLGDFGIAKTVEKTTGGTKIGTYKYMAPEVYNNQPYGTSADIYSLGLVLYWLLNNRRMPFLPPVTEKLKAGMEEKARQRRLDGEQIPSPANGSDALKKIVLKACAFDLNSRYHFASEMFNDLNAIGVGTSTSKDATNYLDVLEVQPQADSVPEKAPVVGGSTNNNCQKQVVPVQNKQASTLNIALIAVWLASVVSLLWTLRNVPLYVPHLIDGSCPWIYFSLSTGWCVPLLALWGQKKKRNTIFGFSIKQICWIACVIQSILAASSILFVAAQAFLQFIPGAILLSETYWMVGKHANEWMPFAVCLLAFVLLVSKDNIAFIVSAKMQTSERYSEEIDKTDSVSSNTYIWKETINRIKVFLFKWFPIVLILLYLLLLLF